MIQGVLGGTDELFSERSCRVWYQETQRPSLLELLCICSTETYHFDFLLLWHVARDKQSDNFSGMQHNSVQESWEPEFTRRMAEKQFWSQSVSRRTRKARKWMIEFKWEGLEAPYIWTNSKSSGLRANTWQGEKCNRPRLCKEWRFSLEVSLKLQSSSSQDFES